MTTDLRAAYRQPTPEEWKALKNPARFPALHHAARRATQEGKPMCVYTREVPGACNLWFVRPEGDAPPAGAALVETVPPGRETYSQF